MALTNEQVTWGYDANPTDGCLGMDEELGWAARGLLETRETFSYSFREPDCHAFRIITASGQARHGKSNLLITLDVYDTLYSWHVEGSSGLCFQIPSGDGKGMKYWRATITNLGSRKELIFSGSDYDAWFYPGSRCP